MLFKISCNPMHHLYGAQTMPYVPVRVTGFDFISHIGKLMCLLAAEPAQYRRTFTPLSVSLWNDLAYPVFNGVGLSIFKSRANANAILLTLATGSIFCQLLFYLSLLSPYRLVLWGWGLRTDRKSLSPSLALPTSFKNNNNTYIHSHIYK